jgi:hypothetical protein
VSNRAFIAALQVSLDGYIQGANAEIDWVDSWNDALGREPEEFTVTHGQANTSAILWALLWAGTCGAFRGRGV